MSSENKTYKTYETKRGLKVGDKAVDILKKYPRSRFSFDIVDGEANDDESSYQAFLQKKDAIKKNFKVLDEVLANEPGMGLLGSQYILIVYDQFSDGTKMLTDEALGYSEGMSNDEYSEWFTHSCEKYDCYHMGIAVKNGEVEDVSTSISTQENVN